MKWKYGIGIFLALILLCFAYNASYHFAGKYPVQEKDPEFQAKQDWSVKQTGEVAVSVTKLDADSRFYLTAENGLVIVFRNGSKDVYEYTNIKIISLPDALQEEIRNQKFVAGFSELYNFLENYST